MTEPVESAAPETPEQTAPEAEQPKTFTEDYVKELRAEAAKYRTEAKQFKAEVENQRKASMTDAERIAAEAEERGAQRVRSEYGQRLAQTEFRAAAAARNAGYDVGKALKYVNLSALVGEDGEPDGEAIAAAVADLVPEAGGSTPPSFDGGTRQAAPAGSSMTDLIRQAAGRA